MVENCVLRRETPSIDVSRNAASVV